MFDPRKIARRYSLAGLALALSNAASAQSMAGAVLAKREPHHHLVYEDSTIRVLRVRVPPHDTTLLHEHDPDYFWVALGPSTLVNVKPGSPDATVTSTDLEFHYSFGNFAHVARNPGSAPFDNITVELLERQTNVRNLCEPAVANKPLDCPASAAKAASFVGATEHPALTSDQLRVSLVTLPPGGAMRPTGRAHEMWVIALDTADVGARLKLEGKPKWVGGTFRTTPGQAWAVKNETGRDIRVIAVIKP